MRNSCASEGKGAGPETANKEGTGRGQAAGERKAGPQAADNLGEEACAEGGEEAAAAATQEAGAGREEGGKKAPRLSRTAGEGAALALA